MSNGVIPAAGENQPRLTPLLDHKGADGCKLTLLQDQDDKVAEYVAAEFKDHAGDIRRM